MRFASHFESLSNHTISFVRHEVPRKRLIFRVLADFNSAITRCPLESIMKNSIMKIFIISDDRANSVVLHCYVMLGKQK